LQPDKHVKVPSLIEITESPTDKALADVVKDGSPLYTRAALSVSLKPVTLYVNGNDSGVP
jgi:hypothetical protein